MNFLKLYFKAPKNLTFRGKNILFRKKNYDA